MPGPVPVPVPVPVRLNRHLRCQCRLPAPAVPAAVLNFLNRCPFFFAILSFFFINCPLIIPFFCLSLASSSLIKKLLIFLCPFHHFFLFLINKVYPPGSKCEALWLGFHLILLYFIRIFVVGTECDYFGWSTCLWLDCLAWFCTLLIFRCFSQLK